MLRFTKLTMENFGPYVNKETIIFPAEDGVVLIRGKNGRGKTSILSALRFVLFGSVVRNGKQLVPLDKYVNRIGKECGNYWFKITLNVLMNSDEYEITRQFTKKSDVGIPESDKDYQVKLSIKNTTKSSVLVGDEISLFLKQIMTEPVSRFFLFDGELLKEYNTELSENNIERANKIREGIEKILGVPVLQNSHNHLKSRIAEFDKVYQSAINNDRNTSDLGKQREGLLQQKKTLEDEIETQNLMLEDIKAELRENNERAVKFSDTREVLAKKEGLETVISQFKEEQQQLIERKKAILPQIWKYLLSSRLSRDIEKVDAEITLIEDNQRREKERNDLIEKLKKSITDDKCEFCKQTLNLDARKTLEKLLDEQKSVTDVVLSKEEEARLHDLKSLSLFTKLFKSSEIDTAVSSLKNIENDYLDKQRKIELKNLELNDLLDQLSASPMTGVELNALFKEISRLEQKKTEIQTGISADDARLTQIKGKIANIDKKLRSGVNSREIDSLRSKKEYLDKLDEIFETSIDYYKDLLRESVEKDATEIFRQLSSETEYQKLTINKNYHLDIIHDNGDIIDLPSSGYEHLVSFALIGALHKNAPIRSPLFMDTSFGRLDQDNSTNLIRVLPKLSNQVIILVHDREIDEETLNRYIPDKITAKYTIERINANESRLVGGEI